MTDNLAEVLGLSKEDMRPGQAASVETKAESKIVKTIVLIAIFLIMFATTTYAVFLSVVTIKDNYFETNVLPELVINEGTTIFDGSELKMEPGKRVNSDFIVKCSCPYNVWCRIYLDNISGELEDCITFRIFQNNAILFESPANEFNEEKPFVLPFILTPDYQAGFKIEVEMDKSAGNEYQNEFLQFDIVAQAVQTKNNPEKDFTIYE